MAGVENGDSFVYRQEWKLNAYILIKEEIYCYFIEHRCVC